MLVQLILLVKSGFLLGKFVDAVLPEPFNTRLFLLLVFFFVFILRGEDAHDYFVEDEAEYFLAVKITKGHPKEAYFSLGVVVNAYIVNAAGAVEVAHYLALHCILHFIFLPRILATGCWWQLLAEILSQCIHLLAEAIVFEVEVAAETHLLFFYAFHNAAMGLFDLQAQPGEDAFFEAGDWLLLAHHFYKLVETFATFKFLLLLIIAFFELLQQGLHQFTAWIFWSKVAVCASIDKFVDACAEDIEDWFIDLAIHEETVIGVEVEDGHIAFNFFTFFLAVLVGDNFEQSFQIAIIVEGNYNSQMVSSSYAGSYQLERCYSTLGVVAVVVYIILAFLQELQRVLKGLFSFHQISISQPLMSYTRLYFLNKIWYSQSKTIMISCDKIYYMQKAVERQDYKFLIDTDCNKRVQLTAIDNFTAEMFQSQWEELHHISPATIQAALRKENPHITYCQERTQKSAAFTFIVNFQFLPKISEQIYLHLVEQAEVLNKIQMARLVRQIGDLQRQINKISLCKMQYKQIQRKGIPLIRLISAGRNLIQFSGFLVINYDSNYDFDGEMITKSVPLVLQVFESEKEGNFNKLGEQIFNVHVSTYEGYQYPFKFSHLVDLKQNGRICLKIGNNTQTIYTAMLTVTSL